MGNTTDMLKKSGAFPVLIVGAAFIAVDLGVLLPFVLKEFQAKSKAVGLDTFDVAMLFIAITSCVGKTVASFMNKSYTRLADQMEETRKVENATALRLADERMQAQRDFGAKP